MRTRLLTVFIVLATGLAGVRTAEAQARLLLELTFDDAPDGTGPADGHADVNNLQVEILHPGDELHARLVGGAVRTSLGEGRYGRGVRLRGGTDAIEVVAGPATLSSVSTVGLAVWVRPDAAADGWLALVPGSFGFRFLSGDLVLSIRSGAGWTDFPTGVTLPPDGAFHHIIVSITPAAGTAAATLDFGAPVELSGLPTPPMPTGLPSFGQGFAGIFDELYLTNFVPGPLMLFDLDPSDCGRAGYSCAEETVTMTPGGWDLPESFRLKTVWDPARCSATSPCPLLIWISGGGACADDYPPPGNLWTFVDAGWVVAAIDPFCLNVPGWRTYPYETSQVVAAAAFLDTMSTLAPLVAGPDFSAIGFSHGAGVVAALVIRERPATLTRGFAISPCNLSSHCAYHEVSCADVRRYGDEYTVGVPYPHDDSDPSLLPMHEAAELYEDITAEVAASVDLGISWGLDTSPSMPICTPDGATACFEESVGCTVGSRRARDRWSSVQPADSPTGFFVEHDGADCVHGLGASAGAGPIWACVRCFLRDGRAAMATSCPECLALSGGGPAGICPVTCSATGCTVGAVDGGPSGGMDAGAPAVDGGVFDGGTAGIGGDDGGCGCRVEGRAAAEPWPCLAFVAWLCTARRRARRPRGR